MKKIIMGLIWVGLLFTFTILLVDGYHEVMHTHGEELQRSLSKSMGESLESQRKDGETLGSRTEVVVLGNGMKATISRTDFERVIIQDAINDALLKDKCWMQRTDDYMREIISKFSPMYLLIVSFLAFVHVNIE